MNVSWLPSVALALGLSLPAAVVAGEASKPAPGPKPGPPPGRAPAGPLKDVGTIVFAVRVKYDDPHWYANIGYYCEDEGKKAYAGNGATPDAGKLCALDVRTGAVTTLLDDPGGSVRDPQVHYDAGKVLFSYRKSGTDTYHLYEINVDGTGLRQITSGAFDDYEPAYLPDGGIVFVSTRCRCWVNCWTTQVGVLYRCDADGGHVRRISRNAEHDNTPWVMPDGRILYTRWEYVDRSQVEFHHLWTMNPDGTGQRVYYGNMNPGVLMIDAKPIPGTDTVLANFSPGHGVNEHQGIATVVTPEAGPDEPTAARALHKGLVKDPYPLPGGWVLAARGNQIVLIDGSTGAIEPVHTWAGAGELHEPRPVVPRPREPVLPDRSDPAAATGQMVLADVYQGRNLEGVARGSIRKLLVLEILPKPVNFSGGPDLTSWLGTFTLERVLGTVPVEADGSASFEVPAGRPVFFVALDERDLAVKRMHSFTSVEPGEVSGCVGCHEPRSATSRVGSTAALLALRRPPSRIERFAGQPDVLDFPRDIQPILDRYCVECHNPERREGGVALAGDLGPQWSHSFYTLFARRQVADGRNGLGNDAPRSVGSAASPLLRKLEGGHHGVKASEADWRTVWLWIESAAPYAGSYAGLRNPEEQARDGRAAGHVFGGVGDVLRRRCASCHALGDPTNETGRALPFQPLGARTARGVDRPTGVHERVILEDDPLAKFGAPILINFTRPELSTLLLGPLAKAAGGYGSCGEVFEDTDDPDYRAMLAAIRGGQEIAAAAPRYGAPEFQPNPQYVREMKRFGILPATADPAAGPIDIFATDQAYWRSFWYRPEGPAAGEP